MSDKERAEGKPSSGRSRPPLTGRERSRALAVLDWGNPDAWSDEDIVAALDERVVEAKLAEAELLFSQGPASQIRYLKGESENGV